MPFIEVMHNYFRGEKLEAWCFLVPIGVLLCGLAVVALRAERPGFAWGIAAPCIVFGLVAIGTGATVGLRTNAQAAALEEQFSKDPAAMLKEELPRLQRVNKSFEVYLAGYAVFALLGVGLRFLLRADWAEGLGSALVLIAGIGFLIDGFASRRAHSYTTELNALAKQHDVTQGES